MTTKRESVCSGERMQDNGEGEKRSDGGEGERGERLWRKWSMVEG